MKRLITILWLMCASCFALENPITADDLGTWLSFDKPVTLIKVEKKSYEMEKYGELICCSEYASATQTLWRYRIALYKGATLFGERRATMEKGIENSIANLKALDPNQEKIDVEIMTRPDGRKVFVSLMGFGPGGVGYWAFTTLPGGKYDLLVMSSSDSEHGLPSDQRLLNPARPSASLSAVFNKVEEKVIEEINNGSQQSGPAYPPQGVGSADP